MRSLRRAFDFPFFPLLFGVYPALAMLGANAAETAMSSANRALVFSVLFTLAVWGGSSLLLRDVRKAALFSALVIGLFFSYGHAYNLLAGHSFLGFFAWRHRVLALIFLALLAVGGAWAWRLHSLPAGPVRYLNLVSALMVAMPLVQAGDYALREARSNQGAPETAVAGAVGQPGASAAQPDMYYLILDMYTRDDVLQEEFGYDNSAFLAELESLGFFVARCALSNYSQTQLSLASSLNMEYLENLGDFAPGSDDRTTLDNLIEHSAARREFEARGYRMVSLSAYEPLQVESAAFYYSTDPRDLPTAAGAPVLSAFEALFIKSTGALAFLEAPPFESLPLVEAIQSPYADHVRQQLYILDQMEVASALPGPKFVFVHVQIPHPPFVFGPDGQIVADPPPFPFDPSKPLTLERRNRLYTDQVTYANRRILAFVQKLLARPGPRPVIILQGDHGISENSRTAILNAYFVPPEQRAALYPGISPVNSFRFLLDQNFGARLGLLPDASYVSAYADPYLFDAAVDRRPGCQNEP
jgi:hypothetical protein